MGSHADKSIFSNSALLIDIERMIVFIDTLLTSIFTKIDTKFQFSPTFTTSFFF